MPLMVLRLRKSKAWVKARRNPALGFYMLNLWMAAWHEVPAGSLDDDDDVLADAAMCDPSKWVRVREDVLRGWVKCSDGRLYHPVVSERVQEAWASKQERRKRDEHERDRKRLEREERARLFDALKSAGIHKPWNTNLADLRKAVHDLSGGQVPDSPAPVPDLSRLREGQGEGEGYGEGQGDSSSVPTGTDGASAPPPSPAPPPPAPPPTSTDYEERKRAAWNGAKSLLHAARMPKAQTGTFLGKLAHDYGGDILIEVMESAIVQRPAEPDAWMRAACQRAAGQRAPATRTQTAQERRMATMRGLSDPGDDDETRTIDAESHFVG
ncbi:DUF1376 domain-containing protein [Ottowia sp. VDI28]|uniref:DUF1376 domain-containing protein n=1 Tax=Ottowia sp. VDI28 TaxID=3133968 RepID=UPI003C2F1CCA